MSRRSIAAGHSCIECRRRKIKCDRAHPCSYCVKTKNECAYPSPTPRATVNTDADVVRRMERLEHRFDTLEQSVTEMKQLVQANISIAPSTSDFTRSVTHSHNYQEQPRNHEYGNVDAAQDSTQRNSQSNVLETRSNDATIRFMGLFKAPPSLRERGQAKSSFIELDSDPDKMEEQLETLRPDPVMIFFLWSKYRENIDPVFKIFHTPTVQNLVLTAARRKKSLDAAENSLLFAIYYASIVSMSESECYAEFEEERPIMLERFRTGIQSCISSVDFVGKPNMTILQAFVIYLMTGRCDANGPDVHSLTGLVIGNALKLGLNRDGEILGLPPFETEMRRRLWWQLCTLDVRTADEHGSDPCILESSFNTKLPLNIPDNGLDPEMKTFPVAEAGRTEMLSSLVQFEASYLYRRVGFSEDFSQQNSKASLTETEKIDAITSFEKRIKKQYLSYCDMDIPLDFTTKTFYRMALGMINLAVEKSSAGRIEDRSASNSQLEHICISILSDAYEIRNYKSGEKWLWLFHPHIELYSMNLLLLSLREELDEITIYRTLGTIADIYNYWKHNPELRSEDRWERIEELRSEILREIEI